MIHELFGGAAAGLIGSSTEDRKISIAEALLLQPSPHSPSPLNSCFPSFSSHISTTTTTSVVAKSTIPSSTTTTTAATTNSETQNLKCPRCNSTNTKFCYYNNYNLTQPRHFCKTCRRYWTKGGALRNVPIGGGCRKNKCSSSSPSRPALGKSTTISSRAKMVDDVPNSSTEFGRQGLLGDGFVSSNQMFWPSPDHNSHIFALLRAAQNPNPNYHNNLSSSTLTMKSEQGLMMGTDQNLGMVMSTPPLRTSVGSRGSESSSYNNDLPFVDLHSLFKMNNQYTNQQLQHGSFFPIEAQSSKIQLIRPSSSAATCGYGDHLAAAAAATVILSSNLGPNSSSSAATSSATFEPPTRGGADLSFMNTNSLSNWANLPTPHGAHP